MSLRGRSGPGESRVLTGGPLLHVEDFDQRPATPFRPSPFQPSETATQLLTSLRDAGLAGSEVRGNALPIDLNATQVVVKVGEPSPRFGQWMLPVTARCEIPGRFSADLRQLMQAFQPLASLCSWHWDAHTESSVVATRWFVPASFTTDDLRFLRDALGILTLEVIQRAAVLGAARVVPRPPLSTWLDELRKRIE